MAKQGSRIVFLEDIELDVHYTYFPPFRGARDSFMGRRGAGPQLEPDEPATVDIDKVMVGEVDIISLLSERQIEIISDKVMSGIGEDMRSYREDER